MSARSTLFDALQRDFCPPLDTSLLAALFADLESNEGPPSARQIDDLRTILQELATQADESQLSEYSDFQLTTPTDDTSSTPDFYHGQTATSSSLGSDSVSESSQHSFSSPLGFLQAALPHVSTKRLRSALVTAEGDEIDMWDIIAGILTEESIREMEERGLDDDDEFNRIIQEDWHTVERKRPKKAKHKTPKGKTISLIDVRQQHHNHSRSDATKGPHLGPTTDPWSQVSSLSTYLATLLPPHPPPFFQSYFHSPDHGTPYQALHSCLSAICQSDPGGISEEYTASLFAVLDVLLPQDNLFDCEESSRLISDTELALHATQGRGDDALDLVKLLWDLHCDSSSGSLEMGVYHLPPASPVETKRKNPLPSGPPPIQPPPRLRIKEKPPPSESKKPSPFQWQAIPQKKPINYGPHPLAPHIPAYARDVNGIQVKGKTYKNSKGDEGLKEYRRKVGESMRKRNDLLREATRMWQKGNAKTRGGEVAFYFAERARTFQELARSEALNAARTMVESKRLASKDQATVDLHGTTAAEATVIVKEILAAQGSSQNKPLKIITGRGTHSVNQISVLKPAVKKALVEDGWIVGAWDGGLVVRGKR